MTPFIRKKSFPITSERVEKSPFSSVDKVKESLKKVKRKESIGFTAKNSLIAMGLLKNKNNVYAISPKYQ